MDSHDVTALENRARAIRRHIIRMVGGAGSGHPGGSLSSADIVATLFFQEMTLKPGQPDWPDRDRFVLSKGHAAPVLYGALYELGYFPEDWMDKLRQVGSPLQGHPDMTGIPGVDMSTGSLGTGFSAAVGLALAARLDESDRRTYVLLGDGECEEGQVWEAAMAAAHYKLDHLIAFVDRNGLQIDGACQEVMNVSPLEEKFLAFGWDVQTIDGHNFGEITQAVAKAKEGKDKPQMIIAKTVKGQGVSYMENACGWHGKAPNADQCAIAYAELQGGEDQ